jgi:hypothetical protein
MFLYIFFLQTFNNIQARDIAREWHLVFAMTCFSFIKINSKILRPALAKPLGLHTVQTWLAMHTMTYFMLISRKWTVYFSLINYDSGLLSNFSKWTVVLI